MTRGRGDVALIYQAIGSNAKPMAPMRAESSDRARGGTVSSSRGRLRSAHYVHG